MGDLLHLLGAIPAPVYILLSPVVLYAVQRLVARRQNQASLDETQLGNADKRIALLKKLDDTVTAQGVQIAEGREKQAKTEAELKSLHRRISTLEDQLREARRAATQAIAAKRRSDEQILALELELHQVQAELNQTSAKLTLSEAARKKLQLRIDELEDQLADLRANLGAAATPITQPIDLDSAAAVEAGLPTVEG